MNCQSIGGINKLNKALFLDRDGIINVEKNYVYKIEEFKFIDGVFDTLKFFQDRGYLLIIITNQSGIGRGYYTEEDFHVLNDWMIQEFEKRGVNITKVYYSPFHSEYGIEKYKRDSFCRKPNPGMILQAKEEFDIDLTESILIGDKETDIEAGINAGLKINILVGKSHKYNEIDIKADYIINNIKDIIRLLDKKLINVTYDD